MRKAAIVGLVFCLVAGIAACKKGKYSDVGPVMEKFIGANESFVAALEKSASADDVAAALNACAEKMTELAPKMKALVEKYPELKGSAEAPAELKALDDRMKAMMQKMMQTMGKAAPYMSDPKVAAAQQKYAQAMAEMK